MVPRRIRREKERGDKMTDKQIKALRVIFALTPWKKDRVSKAIGAYLDGNTDTLKGMPTTQAILDQAIHTLIDTEE